MNWGGFAGGFSQGFNNGVNMGKTIGDVIKQKKLEDIRAQGIAEATAARDQASVNSVRENGVEAATPATAPNTATPPPPELSATPQSTPAPAAPAAQPAPAPSNDAPPQRPQPAPSDPELNSTPQALPMPITPVPTTGSAPQEAPAMPAVQGITTPPKRFSVGGKSFDTREEALAHAKKNQPSIMDYMSKTLVPKMQEAYLAQGDMEKAEAWGKWAKEKKNEKNMETWSNAYRAAQAGDMEGAANHVFELYKGYDDGITPVSKETVKDKSGNVTGFNVRLKTEATGEERTQFIDKKALTEMGLSALSPPAMFEQVYKRQSAADQITLKATVDAQNDQRTAVREEARDRRTAVREDTRDARTAAREDKRLDKQHSNKLDEMVAGDQLKTHSMGEQERAKLQTKIDLARESGASEDEIKAMVPHLLGGAGYKKTTDPTERRAIVIDTLMKNDPMFARGDQADQEKKVKRMMTLTYGEDPKPATTSGAPAAKPSTSQQAAPVGLSDGVYKDRETGEVFRVKAGQRVPVK